MTARVLLVDDDPTLLRALNRTLDEDFDIETAESGAEALAVMRNNGPFSVVVTDLKMPRMDGVELVGQIQAKWPSVVCIMLTGNQDEASALRAMEVAKVFRLLTKPARRADLVAAINSAIEHSGLDISEVCTASDAAN